MFWRRKTTEPEGQERDEIQAGNGSGQGVARVSQELIRLCHELGPKALEALRAESAARGEVFAMTVGEVLSTDVVRILVPFVQANGSATVELGQILALVGDGVGDTTLSEGDSADAGIFLLNEMAGQYRREPAAPEIVAALARYDHQHGTRHSVRAAEIFLRLVSIAARQGRGAGWAESKCRENLAPYADGSAIRKVVPIDRSGQPPQPAPPASGQPEAQKDVAHTPGQLSNELKLRVIWRDVAATYQNRLKELQKARSTGGHAAELLANLVKDSEERLLALCTAADKMSPAYNKATADARAAIERNRSRQTHHASAPA